MTVTDPVNVLSICSKIDVRNELSKIVNSETTPTPMSSAAADHVVRRGLRVAFSRAMSPVMPLRATIGAPRIRPMKLKVCARR